MIDVRLFASLAAASERGRRVFKVEARPGLTVVDIIREAGMQGQELYIVVVNGRGASSDTVLEDGDRVGLFPPMSGG